MTTYLALLRAVNLGGYNKVSMADLRDFLKELGFAEPRTLLQSGNAVFRGPMQAAPALETRLETEAAARLGAPCDFIIRTAAQWRQLVDANPMPAQAASDPSHFVVMCLKQPPPEDAVPRLRAAIQGPEVFALVGRDLYLHYPVDIGHSKVTNAFIEGKLTGRGTARNWNTVNKIAALLAAEG